MAILQYNGYVMHEISDLVNVDLDMLGPLSMNLIFQDIYSTLIVTKNDSRSGATNIKLI